MNDEDAFNAALDAHPEDQVARRMFADWLLERSDTRGPGYLALAELGRVPKCIRRDDGYWCWGYSAVEYGAAHYLSAVWIGAGWTRAGRGAPSFWIGTSPFGKIPRSVTEDAAAIQWSEMPEYERRQCINKLAPRVAEGQSSTTRCNHER